MKSWMLDIKNESMNFRCGEDQQQDWWSATFDQVSQHSVQQYMKMQFGVCKSSQSCNMVHAIRIFSAFDRFLLLLTIVFA